MKKISLKVNLKNNSYPIIIGENIIKNSGAEIIKVIKKTNKFLIVTDKNIPKIFIKSVLQSIKSKRKYLLILMLAKILKI